MPFEKIVFTPNVPQTVALKFSEGRIVEGRFGNQVMYTLMDGRVMYLDLGPAEKINALEPAKGELFNICKRWTGKKTDSPVWDVWPVGDQETQPAPRVSQQSQLEADLIRSVEHVRARQATASVSAPAAAATALQFADQIAQPPTHNGNGSSNGNGAYKPYQAAGIPAPPVKIPYDVAFRELLQIVIDGLKAAGEQWSDSAKQDALSTLLIQASRDGFLACWNRGVK